VSIINETDSQHEKGIGVLNNVNKDDISIFDYTYTETLTVLKIKYSLENCAKFLALLNRMGKQILVTESFQYKNTHKYFFDERKNLSFTDCLLISTAMSKNAQIITFDKDLETYWNQVIKDLE
jgi:predicted nucleic acid-binding protein